MRSVVKTGKTIDEAVNEALEELGVSSLDEVTIDILEEAKSGFLGVFGSKDAVVRVSTKEDAFQELLIHENIKERPVHKEPVKKSKEEEVAPAAKPEKETQASRKLFPKKAEETSEKASKKTKEWSSIAPTEEEEPVSDKKEESRLSRDVEEDASAPASENSFASWAENKRKEEASVGEISQNSADSSTSEEESSSGLSDEEARDFVRSWLDRILQEMHIDGQVEECLDGDNFLVEITGISDNDMGIVIGRRAETLNALQYLLSIAMNRSSKKHYRVFVDVGGYRGRRKAGIEKIARRSAEKVLKYHKTIALEPMNAYERRIVHTSLQSMDSITTISEGREPYRKVVIRYEK